MNKVFVILFTLIGLVCIGAALFAGAWHQLIMAGICAVVILPFWFDKTENKQHKL